MLHPSRIWAYEEVVGKLLVFRHLDRKERHKEARGRSKLWSSKGPRAYFFVRALGPHWENLYHTGVPLRQLGSEGPGGGTKKGRDFALALRASGTLMGIHRPHTHLCDLKMLMNIVEPKTLPSFVSNRAWSQHSHLCLQGCRFKLQIWAWKCS